MMIMLSQRESIGVPLNRSCILKQRPFGPTRKLGGRIQANASLVAKGSLVCLIAVAAPQQAFMPAGRQAGRLVLRVPKLVGCRAAAIAGHTVKSLDGESDDDLVAPAPSLSHKYM